MLQTVSNEIEVGDIVEGLFFPLLTRIRLDFVRVSDGMIGSLRTDISPETDEVERGLCVVPAIRRRAMVLSTKSVDASALLVAPLFPISERVSLRLPGTVGHTSEIIDWASSTTEQKTDEMHALMHPNKYPSLFPVANLATLRHAEPSVVDMHFCSSISTAGGDILEYVTRNRHWTLTKEYRAQLQLKMIALFGP
jgi:hypothetical protein